MEQTAKLEGALSDGSRYIFYTKNSQHIYKDVEVSGVVFTVCRLHERRLENPKVKHIYTLTAGTNHQEYACVTLDSNLDKVASYIAGDIGRGEAEYIVPNFPHETVLREEEPQITFAMFIEAVQTSDIFDFNHPEILKILGETSAEA
jgi:hypothetical protein